ncbi:MAG: DoxX family membrane protein [Ignavibacteria bacterium]|nr:DoxX family membrane protein [Ignavibacteria bacterium]MBI3765868.1 DoxX family membrane protein [Ignavibacteriales bacterium]
MKFSNIQILLLRLAIGGLFLNAGLGKYNEGWLTNPAPLVKSLDEFHQHATGFHRHYLDYVALPYAGAWAKLMTVGELAVGVSLLLGLLVRLSSAMGIFMVLNFLAANGSLYSLNFFGSPWAALLLSGLLTLFLSRAGRWVGVDVLLAKSNSKGTLW